MEIQSYITQSLAKSIQPMSVKTIKDSQWKTVGSEEDTILPWERFYFQNLEFQTSSQYSVPYTAITKVIELSNTQSKIWSKWEENLSNHTSAYKNKWTIRK